MFKERLGFSLIEIIVGSAILLTVFVVIGGVARYALELSTAAESRIRSAFLATEGVEAVKTMRDRGWTSAISPLALNVPLYLVWSGGGWSLTATPSTVDGVFTRTVTLSAVSRNASDDIAASGGTNDPNTRKVVVSVVWSDRGIARHDAISTYITNLFSN